MAATAPIASIHLETVRIAPTPLLRRRPTPPNPTGLNVSWFKQSGKPCMPARFRCGARYVWCGSGCEQLRRDRRKQPMADASKANPQGVERLGYLGLGLMGTPMTRRLLKAGYQVTVWNRSEGKVAPLVEAGAKRAATPRDALANSDIVFMCVTDADAVEEVIFGPEGISGASGAGKLVVDFSSIHPDAARNLATRLKAANGAGWIDAPVSGGTKGAEEGTLAIMAGGEATAIERVRPYILAMARRFTHMGAIGAGQTTKLCNQVIVGCAMAVLAEATRLAVNAGIDANRLPEALAGGFADSIPLQLFVPRMVQGIHSPPLGHIATMLKDLDTIADVAQATSTPVPMATLAGQLFRLAKTARGADADALEIYKLSAEER
ncbi:NAD(P)-dependent oxidoreductase [Bradyrhizobium sp. LTSP849]|uniref:NAD(P)-dependent oxidoreductase n=1 Tax=Bradyrhizobium sp. LTSP849 TaxID=1615890 RepID=UPI001FD9E6A2|nr:NAD(P)-dependent oxidoreductase [Bradyrhizobium sp. LTSP849]